jgi:hypothetical protein
MEGESFLWLVRHAAVAGVDGMIHSANAPAELSDRAHLDAVRRHLPSEAASYASPARRTIETARALGLDPVLMAEFASRILAHGPATVTTILLPAAKKATRSSGKIPLDRDHPAAKASKTRWPGPGWGF